jgi:hypothetical protein
MEYSIRYCSSRSDIWHWYWRFFKDKLWRIHVLFAVIMAFSFSGSNLKHIDLFSWGLWYLAWQPMVTVLFATIPQILFKSSERILRVDKQGWATQIGKKSASRTWAQVASIRDDSGYIIITGTNGNALIIPKNAFSEMSTREQFIKDVQQWKSAYPN